VAGPLCFKLPTVLSRLWRDVREAVSLDVDQLAFRFRMPVSAVIAACLVDAQNSFEPLLRQCLIVSFVLSLRSACASRAW
jgi:hypothetical protein